jgi:hypothetical protein
MAFVCYFENSKGTSMSYEEFVKFVQSKCMHEAIYEDSEGRVILVIELLDAYDMINKLNQPTGLVDSKLNPIQRTWVGLTDIDYAGLPLEQVGLVRWAEAKLKEKNT